LSQPVRAESPTNAVVGPAFPLSELNSADAAPRGVCQNVRKRPPPRPKKMGDPPFTPSPPPLFWGPVARKKGPRKNAHDQKKCSAVVQRPPPPGEVTPSFFSVFFGWFQYFKRSPQMMGHFNVCHHSAAKQNKKFSNLLFSKE